MFNDLAKTFSYGQKGGSNYDSVQEYITGNFNIEFVMYFLVIIIFIGIGVYVYYEYIDKKPFSGNNEFNEPDENKSTKIPVIHYFTASWCPHCCKIKENALLWTYLTTIDSKKFGDYNIEFKIHEDTNGDNPEEDKKTKSYMEKYNINGFPTLILDVNDDIYEFEAKIEQSNIEEFLETVLNSD